MKDTLLNILNRGEFHGSREELTEIVFEHQIDCKWKEYRDAIWVRLESLKLLPGSYFGLDSRCQKMCFWPETGRVVHCWYDNSRPVRQSDLDWRGMRPESNQREWRTYKFPGLGRLSLPELFLRRPKYAFEEIVYGSAPCDKLDFHELAEMFDKISAIRLPGYSKGARAITNYRGKEGVCTGFLLTKDAPYWRAAQSNRICVARHIDLCRAAFDYWGEGLFSSPIPSLMMLFEGDPSAVWDRQQCTAFFNDKRRFIEPPYVEFNKERAMKSGIRIL